MSSPHHGWTNALLTSFTKYSALVAELPQFYAVGKGKGNPNKLALLTLVVGAVAGQLAVPCYDFLPAEWIGGVPKAEAGDPWKSPRGAIIGSRLRPAERLRVASNHDSVDVAGIGLKILGRLDKGVFPGAT